MIRLGLVSAILPNLSAEEVAAYASGVGFESVEWMCWPRGAAERRYAGVTHVDVDKLDDAAADRLHEVLYSHGMAASGLGYYPNPLDPDPEKSAFFQGHIRKVIRAAAKLGIPVVNTFIGRDPSATVRQNIERFRKEWPDIVRLADDLGIRIGIENCPMYFTMDEWPGGKNLATTPDIWDQLFEIIPSPAFGLNYDPSHMVWQMMDPVKPILDYHTRFHHVHLKDVHVHRDRLDRVGILATPLSYHSPRIPGRGDVNWERFFKALSDVGYHGDACIEVEDKDFEGSDADIRKAIEAAYAHIRRFLPPRGA
ncbi:MAG: sugar phosphate isomerase/epimerase [Chitinophagia bacterium]|nr:sugar phosphate isomerase/epimerase [Chitinophagia bacterium]